MIGFLGREVEYAEGNKSRVTNSGNIGWSTAFNNNIMMAGKHYVSIQWDKGTRMFYGGVMRPGKAMESAQGVPLSSVFYEHFTLRNGSRQYSNTVNCCMYSTFDGYCLLSAWGEGNSGSQPWDGMEGLFSSPDKIGMLLDLDEYTIMEESWV